STCCRSRSAAPPSSTAVPWQRRLHRRASLRIARGEIGGERRERPFDPCAGRERTVEAHVEKPPLDDVPRLLAHHQIAADVQQDVGKAGLDAQIAKPAAVELAL